MISKLNEKYAINLKGKKDERPLEQLKGRYTLCLLLRRHKTFYNNILLLQSIQYV